MPRPKKYAKLLPASPPLKPIKVDFEASSSSDAESDRSSEIESNEEGRIPTFHNDEECTPIYEKANKAYYACDILRILSDPHPRTVKCSKQPMRVQYNSSFLIDLTFIPLDDLSADGNGCYVNNGNSTHTYKRIRSGNWKRKSSSRQASLGSNEFHLVRNYRRLKEYPDFRQTVAYLRDQRGDIVGNTAIVQNIFQGKEHEIKIFPHGNAKQSKPFTRTKPSTISALRENLLKYHPSEAISKTRKELGGCFSSNSEASLPRGHTQAYDLKCSNTTNTLSTGVQKSKGKALSDALADTFPLAIHLRCFRHFRCNLQTFLSTLGTTPNLNHSYFEEIFGKQEGNVYQEGLLDACSDDDFDARLPSLRESYGQNAKNVPLMTGRFITG